GYLVILKGSRCEPVRLAHARRSAVCTSPAQISASDVSCPGLSQHVQRPVVCSRGDIDIPAITPSRFQPPEHIMQMRKPYTFILPLLRPLSSPAAAQGVNDGHDKEWRQLTDTGGVTWNQLAAACPQDGQTPCTGTVGTVDLTGWVWASDAQVLAL